MRSKSTLNQVDDYLRNMPEEKEPLAREVRKIIQAAAPHLEECVRWDSPCYFFYGPVCYFATSRSGIHFGFFRGKELSDPQRRLTSRNGEYCHIKIKSPADIDADYFSELLREAVQLNKVTLS